MSLGLSLQASPAAPMAVDQALPLSPGSSLGLICGLICSLICSHHTHLTTPIYIPLPCLRAASFAVIGACGLPGRDREVLRALPGDPSSIWLFRSWWLLAFYNVDYILHFTKYPSLILKEKTLCSSNKTEYHQFSTLT